MANRSSAIGTITFKNVNIHDLTTFIFYFNEMQSRGEYNTEIWDLYANSYKETAEYIQTNCKLNKIEGKYEIKLKFIGHGKWAYIHNLDEYFNLEDYKSEISSITTYKNLIESTSIEVNFTDEESEHAILYQYKASLSAKFDNNNNEPNVYIDTLSKTNYAYTASNLKELCCYTEVYSAADAIKNPNDYFSEDALKQHPIEIMHKLKQFFEPERIYWWLSDFIDASGIPEEFFDC